MDIYHEIQIILSEWYKIHKRDLPWRRTRNPYFIWLSEIILQQTRIEQGLSYYYRFVEQYPDLTSMAAAKEEDILKLWEGLGYYNRAANMYHTAKKICADFEGKFPDEKKILLALKGIGEYTASMILSVAFEQPHVVVDANVIRVVARLFALEDFYDTKTAMDRIKEKAARILDKNNPGDHNQALMDFGSGICKAVHPRCEICVLAPFCLAKKQNLQHTIPRKKNAPKIKNRFLHYYIISDENKICLHKRTEKDIWKNLYDFPLIEKQTKRKPSHSDIRKDLHLSFSDIILLREMKHKLTHRQLFIKFYRIADPQLLPAFPAEKYLFYDVMEIKKMPFPKPLQVFLDDWYQT
jgi:A/G-specific adenine glycosylase